jgi:hypothetical protein
MMADNFKQRMDRLKKLAQREVNAWVPDDGPDEMGGQVVLKETAEWSTDEYESVVPALTLDTGDDALTRVMGFGILADRFKGINVGDFVYIKYLGRVESKTPDHEPYRDFRVVHEPTLS